MPPARRVAGGLTVAVPGPTGEIGQASSDTRNVNVEGSRNVFEAAVAAAAKRLVYASSVAAYGFPEDADGLLTEEMPPRGHPRFPYSAHKAEVEAVLSRCRGRRPRRRGSRRRAGRS